MGTIQVCSLFAKCVLTGELTRFLLTILYLAHNEHSCSRAQTFLQAENVVMKVRQKGQREGSEVLSVMRLRAQGPAGHEEARLGTSIGH